MDRARAFRHLWRRAVLLIDRTGLAEARVRGVESSGLELVSSRQWCRPRQRGPRCAGSAEDGSPTCAKFGSEQLGRVLTTPISQVPSRVGHGACDNENLHRSPVPPAARVLVQEGREMAAQAEAGAPLTRSPRRVFGQPGAAGSSAYDAY